MVIYAGSVRKSGITVKEQSRRSIQKTFASGSFEECIDIEMGVGCVLVDIRKIGLPSNAIVKSQPRCDFPCIRCIQSDVMATVELNIRSAHDEIGHISDKEIRSEERRVGKRVE